MIKQNRLLVVTYLIYIILWKTLVLVGGGYVVFILEKSGWWMVLAVFLSGAAYSPKKWRKLLTKDKENEKSD